MPKAGRLPYPEARQDDIVDDYFGTKVPDPYRWLEDDRSPETKAWVEAQNEITFSWLASVPEREAIRDRVKRLWDHERFGLPSREGPWTVFSRNDGLQNQSVVYRARGLEGAPEVLLDPNVLSEDGTVALADQGTAFTDDGRYLAWASASGGSDWRTWRVRDVATGEDLPDVVQWSKFSTAAWRRDGTGFYYSRYAEPAEDQALRGVNKNQKVYFHRVGTSQEDDELAYERPDHPDWGLGAAVTDDGRFLLVYQTEGTDPKNRIFLRDLEDPTGSIDPFLDAFDAQYEVVGNDDDVFYVRTDNGAGRYRLVAVDRRDPDPTAWKTLIPEDRDRAVLSSASMIGDRFVVVWERDAHHRLRIHGNDGGVEKEVALPGLGSVAMSGKRRDDAFFYSYTSWAWPTTIHRCDPGTGESTLFREPEVAFDPRDFEATQVFFESKDGTRVPLFLVHRKSLERSGQNPTLLYGYGGFNVSLTPSFSVAVVAWLEMGGVWAVANLRGGGEYGKEWHEAGRLGNKQNTFDDFIAAAEYLIGEGYTSSPRLAVYGGSNGGLLVGAVLNQRPDLFGAAIPAVGVMDMLRFHQFTIGWAWKSDYGSAETQEGFETLIGYSPLHNIHFGTEYPAVLITTADHDDRVVPAHSFKYAATLQAAQGGDAPILIRVETRAGHGAGKPTAKQIDDVTDKWTFLSRSLDMKGSGLPGP
ncbi:MAG: prolyl oligopeptidase family serine peptidase [Acidobacteria bacterium]|jgi:prolyl oligopeptidase|nr:prolyl oligopeptidase family serine peptidase [Acidobacteriota bacterium]